MKKTKLNEKVGKLRSQIMSFANDGIQVSLNIPDTSDVENTFGTVIESVTEQQEEIEGIHTDLETSNVENEDTQKKMLAWTISCVQKLKEENERLLTKLLDANKQIKNLSYNMQGFVDQGAADEAEAIPEPLEFDDIPKFKQRTKLESQPEPEESSLFATEEGADMSQGGLSTGITPEIRKFSRYKGPEHKEQVKEMYQSIRPNTLPNEVHARWRWAIRKVISTQRRQKQKVGLTRSRMDSKQTFAGRLDRLEALMLSMQSSLKDQLTEMNKNLNHKIDTSVSRLDREVSTTAGKLDALTEDMDARFKSTLEEISMVDTTMKEFFAKVQQQSSGDSKVLKDTLKAVEVHLRDQIHLEVDSLRSGVQHITKDLDHTEGSADRLLQKVEGLHTLSSTQPVYDPTKPIEQAVSDLTDLLETDTQLRDARYELGRLEAGVGSIIRLLACTHDQVKATSQIYNKESTYQGVVELINISQIEDINDLVERCNGAEGHVKHIESIFAGLNRMCQEHDKVLKDRLKIFSALSQRVRDLGNKTEELTVGQLELQNAAASAPTYNTTDIQSGSNGSGQLSKEQLQMLGRFEKDIIELSLRVTMMESLDLEEEEHEEVVQESTETLPFAGAPEEVIPPAFRTEMSVKSINVSSLEDPIVSATTAEVVVDHTVASAPHSARVILPVNPAPASVPIPLPEPAPAVIPDIATTPVVVETGAPVTAPLISLAAERASAAASPLAVPPTAAPAPSVAPRSTAVVRKTTTTTDKRKASTVANLEMLEARLKPLIERIVATRVEECLQQAGVGDDTGLLEEEEDFEQEQDGFEGEKRSPSTETAPLAVIEEQNDVPVEPPISRSRIQSNSDLVGVGSVGGLFKESSISAPFSPMKSAPSSIGRVRREASRFGGMDSSSGKSRAGSGKHSAGFDITPYVQEIVAMKRENSKLSKAVGKMEEERLSKDDIERLCHHLIATHQANDRKEESMHAIHEMERRIQALTKEISDLHTAHTKSITALQTEFSETLYNVVNTAAETLEADNKESFVNTRSLCLGCGRSSMVRAQPESRPTSPSFFPQLNSQSSLGPDVYRSGFRMPVKNPLNPTYVLEATSQSPGKVRTVKSAGQRMQEALLSNSVDTPLTGSSSLVGNSLDAVLPRVKTAQPRPHTSHNPRGRTGSSGVELEDEDELGDDQMGMGSGMNITGGALEDQSHVFTAEDGSLIIQANKGYQLNIGSTTAPIRGTSAVLKSVRSARPEAEEVRPVYRKGLTGKKSMRAETAYAPDRYELDMPNNILLHSSKINNTAMVRGVEGIMRPYTSQESSNRPRLLPATGGSRLHSTTMNTSASNTKF